MGYSEYGMQADFDLWHARRQFRANVRSIGGHALAT